MCGIAGEIRFDGRRPDRAMIERMNTRQRSRGPDGEGIWMHANTALGHRRLKIIDLSDRAAQPMEDAGLGLTIVFNGCIYNYKTLRDELRQLGYAFTTSSDTEVLLKAYAAWGKDCVERLNGMFAFAVLEHATGCLFVARDRLGIKPFYYAESPDRFRFASSLPALLAVRESSTDIDPVALSHYLTFHSVVPPPQTILNGFRKLPPATRMTIQPDGSRLDERYWEPRYSRERCRLICPSTRPRSACSVYSIPRCSGAWWPTCPSACCSPAALIRASSSASCAQRGERPQHVHGRVRRCR